MTEIVQPPYAGQPMRASWAASVSDGVNRLGVMGPSRMLVREFAGGCGFQPLPANNRWHLNGSLPPFSLRRVKQSEDHPSIDYDGWEIYLPTGCVTVGSTCAPLNPKAYRLDENGEHKEEIGWYRLPAPPDGSDGDIWNVVVHAKTNAAKAGVDEFQAWPKHYVWAEIHDVNEDDEGSEDEGETDDGEETDDASDVGDALTVTTGTVTWADVENVTDTVPTINHSVRTPIFVPDESQVLQFALYYSFEIDDEELTIKVNKMALRNIGFSAAGATFVMDGMKELDKDSTAIYLKISAATSPYTAEVKEYKELTVDGEKITVPEQAAGDKQATDIMLLIYRLENCRVTENYLVSLQNIQLYQ